MMQELERSPGEGLNNERETLSKFVAWTAVKLHPFGVLTGDDPESVVTAQ
jgi:hypothetical protein